MPYSAGTAYLQVIPSFRGIEEELKRQAAKIGKAVDDAVGKGLTDAVDGDRDVDRAAKAGGKKAGERYAGSFATTLKRRLTEAYKSFPKIKDPTTDIDKSIERVRKRIRKALQVPKGQMFDEAGAVALVRRLRRELRDMESEAFGDDRAVHNIRQARGEIDALNDMVDRARRTGREAGGEYAGAFGNAVRARLTTMLRSLPDVHIDDNSDEVARRYAKLRERIERLRDVDIGVDMDEAKFLRKLRKLDADLDKFARSNPTVSVDFNIERAREALRRLPGMAEEVGEDAADRSGGAFADTFRRRVTQSLRDLPEIEPNFNMTGAQFRIYQLRAQLAALNDQEIGVDIDAAAAIAKLQAIQAQLATIALTDPDIDVRTNAAKAAAELFAVLQMAHRIDREDVSINVNEDGLRRLAQNTDIPIHRLGVLIALGASIGPALVPAAAAASVALAGIATAALAAVAGVGVLILGFSGVFGAVKALNTYQEDADKSAKSLAQSQVAVANAADSVRSAERNLANTRESVAYSARRAARAVADAQEAVTDAVRDRQRAEEDLVDAIKAAQRADEDRQRSIRGTALDIRQANLDIAEAKRELDAVLANPRASQEEREQAQITYEQRVLQLDELTARQRDLAEEQAEWNRTGVMGSDQVKSAQERVAAATEKVADSQTALADAIEAQQMQQRQGQAQIESATQSLAQAQRSLQQAYVNAGVAGGEALDNLNDAMKKLTPTGQAFAKFLFGLKDEFLAFRAAAEEGMLPGVQRALEGLLRYAPAMQRFISKVAVGLGQAFEYVVAQMEHPEWQRFFRHLSDSAVPAMLGLVKFGEIFSRGIASLLVSLSAFNGSMGQGLLDWAEGFATWAEKLDERQRFQKFLAYVLVAGPDVLDLLFTMFEFVKRFVIAAAPVGDAVVKAFTLFFAALNQIPLPVLSALIWLIAAFAGAMLLLKLRQVIWNQLVATIANGSRSIQRSIGGLRWLFLGTAGGVSGLRQGLNLLGAAVTRTAAAFAVARTAIAGFFTATMTGARVALVIAASSAMTLYSTAVSRLGAIASAATARLTAFFTASFTGARVALLLAASTAMSVYSAAMTRIGAVVGPVVARVSAFFTAAASGARIAAMRAAALAVTAYGVAMGQLRTLAAGAGSAMGRFYAAVRTQVISAATTAQRLYNRAILDARIAFATAQIAVGRWFTSFRTSTISLASAAQSAFTATVARLGGVVTGAAAGVTRFVTSVNLSAIASTAAARALGVYTATLGVFSSASTIAAGAAGRFATAVGTGVATAAIGAGRALASLALFLGGPWGIAMTAATLLIFDFAMKAADQKAKNEQLRDSLLELAEAYRSTDGSAEQAVQSMLKQNKAIRDLILNAEKFGLTIDDVVRATEGDVEARNRVLAAYDEEEQRLQRLFSAYKEKQEWLGDDAEAHKLLEEQGFKTGQQLADRIKQLQDERNAVANSTAEKVKANEAAELVRQANIDQQRAQQALNEAFKDGARAADILRNAYKSLYGDAQSREEALDAERAAYDRLRASVEKNGATLDANTEAGRENRENMRERIQALADLAAADIAATGTISADTQKRIDTLKQELIQMGFNEAEVEKMIRIYMGVPPKILTEIILNGGANAQGELNEVGKKALEMIATYNLSPSDAMIIAKGGIPPGWRGPSPSALAQAEGGHIRGPGTETSDSIPALLSDNEFVEPAHAVRHYGVGFFEALRHHQVPKEMLPGYAKGGIVDASGVRRFATGGWAGVGGKTHSQKANVLTIPSWQMLKDYHKKLLAQKLQELENQYRSGGDFGPGPGFPPWPSSPGASRGDSGVWRSIVNLIRSTGPLSGTYGNAYRPGDPLWHGCVPMDTQVLTRRGWVSYADVRIGVDETVGYNAKTGRSEWTRIVDMYHYDDAPLWTIRDGEGWEAEVTPGHRWLTEDGLVETRHLHDGSQIRLSTTLAPDVANSVTAGQARLRDWDTTVTGVRRVGERQAEVFCPTTELGTWTARQGGQVFLTGNSGRAVDWMGYNQDALASFLAARRPLELIHRTNSRDYAYTRGVNKGSFNNQLMQDHRNHIHIAMDQGGWLQPGWNSIFNGLGKPEAVLTPRQSSALVAIAQRGDVGNGPRVVNQFQFRDTRLDPGKLAALNRAEEARSRAGRPW